MESEKLWIFNWLAFMEFQNAIDYMTTQCIHFENYAAYSK